MLRYCLAILSNKLMTLVQDMGIVLFTNPLPLMLIYHIFFKSQRQQRSTDPVMPSAGLSGLSFLFHFPKSKCYFLQVFVM